MRRGQGHLRSGERPKLFDAAEADSISLSEGSVDGSRLGDAHFGAADQGRRVRGISITVANKPLRTAGLKNCCAEDPAARDRIGLSFLQSVRIPKQPLPKLFGADPRASHTISHRCTKSRPVRQRVDALASTRARDAKSAILQDSPDNLPYEPRIGTKADNIPLHESSFIAP